MRPEDFPRRSHCYTCETFLKGMTWNREIGDFCSANCRDKYLAKIKENPMEHKFKRGDKVHIRKDDGSLDKRGGAGTIYGVSVKDYDIYVSVAKKGGYSGIEQMFSIIWPREGGNYTAITHPAKELVLAKPPIQAFAWKDTHGNLSWCDAKQNQSIEVGGRYHLTRCPEFDMEKEQD